MGSNMTNIKGTLLPSFKIRPTGGIELISAAVTQGQEATSQFRVKLADDSTHSIAYYDTVVASSNIESLTYFTKQENGYSKDYLKITLRSTDGGLTKTEIELPLTVNSGSLALPQDATNDEIAVYKVDPSTGEVTLGRAEGASSTKIVRSDSLSESEDLSSLSEEVPTATIIKDYIDKNVGILSSILDSRLNGNDVKEVIN